jgi:hypothetical protein
MSAPKPQAQPAAEIVAMTNELADIAERLTRVLTRETELVRAMQVKEIGPLQSEKTGLTALYQKAFKGLAAVNDGASLPASCKERLAVAGKALAAAVVDNELMLRVGKVATERLIGSIVNALKDLHKTSLSYAPKRIAPRHGFMTAAAVDRRL